MHSYVYMLNMYTIRFYSLTVKQYCVLAWATGQKSILERKNRIKYVKSSSFILNQLNATGSLV